MAHPKSIDDYGVIENASGETILHWNDLVVQRAPERRIWTVVDCDGDLWVVAGLHTVNYIGRVVTRESWVTGSEEYRWAT